MKQVSAKNRNLSSARGTRSAVNRKKKLGGATADPVTFHIDLDLWVDSRCYCQLVRGAELESELYVDWERTKSDSGSSCT